MTFKLTFSTYYEAALRELSFIRPFRMISPAALPSFANGELSHSRYRKGAPRVHSATGKPVDFGTAGAYTFRSVSTPSGTGPYKVVHKLLGRPGSTGTFTLPAPRTSTPRATSKIRATTPTRIAAASPASTSQR